MGGTFIFSIFIVFLLTNIFNFCKKSLKFQMFKFLSLIFVLFTKKVTENVTDLRKISSGIFLNSDNRLSPCLERISCSKCDIMSLLGQFCHLGCQWKSDTLGYTRKINQNISCICHCKYVTQYQPNCHRPTGCVSDTVTPSLNASLKHQHKYCTKNSTPEVSEIISGANR